MVWNARHINNNYLLVYWAVNCITDLKTVYCQRASPSLGNYNNQDERLLLKHYNY